MRVESSEFSWGDILTKVDWSRNTSWLTLADCMKSSVTSSSTALVEPLASCMMLPTIRKPVRSQQDCVVLPLLKCVGWVVVVGGATVTGRDEEDVEDEDVVEVVVEMVV